MTKNISRYSDIHSLDTFDKSAFIGNDKVSQDVCNFIMTLACIYNDYKDTLLSLSFLDQAKPSGDFKETAEWGEFSGLKFHIIRIQVALIHELLKLLNKSLKVIEDPFFESVIMQIDSKGKESWQTLVNISQGKDDPHKIANTLMMIRNKISFHYDPKEILKGYKKYFCDKATDKKAYISRGSILKEERYYFADAAAQNYFYSLYDELGPDKFIENMTVVMACIAPAISQIVTRFIQKRGFGWRSVN